MVFINFANKQNLKKHVKAVHEEIKSIDSGMVYIKFTNKQNLKIHVDAVHEGIKSFKCSVCDVKFANNYNPFRNCRFRNGIY